ncbi:MAG: D-aminoacyl-tRNA deacylase [Candidatus Verstraetearchaeota archaeon]|nr:D-aminoacyl-tRNA deacylase [Candidatus Verstraetearchaeota archaeon]
MKLLIYSASDPAGVNIARHLEAIVPFAPSEVGGLPAGVHGDLFLLETDSSLINLDLDLKGIEWALCLSRHKSSSGKPCLTAHTPGNPGISAEYGGRPSAVCISNPWLQSALIRSLRRECDSRGVELQVTVEATHHGPTDLDYPVTFVEIGSDESSWGDPLLGEIVASAVRSSLQQERGNKGALGVGGGHYSEKFTKLILDGDFDIGHIVPKYVLSEGFDPGIFKICKDRTLGDCRYVLVDWKGTPSKAKDCLKSAIPTLGAELVKI